MWFGTSRKIQQIFPPEAENPQTSLILFYQIINSQVKENLGGNVGFRVRKRANDRIVALRLSISEGQLWRPAFITAAKRICLSLSTLSRRR